MLAGFPGLQTLEARLVKAAFATPQPSWVLEVAPSASASPEVSWRQSRVLINTERCRWPFHAELDQWPLEDDSVSALLLRHLWQPAIRADLLSEALRVLRPGGRLVSISANPWHRMAWRELGRSALHLPSWPQFQWMHSRHGLELSISANDQIKSLVPGLTPVLVVVARKPAETARVSPIRFRQPRMATGAAVPSQCRAA